jgi:hypothetical protein
LVAYNCYAQGVFATCDAAPGGPYPVPITTAGGGLLGCVVGGRGCPDSYPFEFLTVTSIGSSGASFTTDRCYAQGELATCQTPAVVPPATVLIYSTPEYTGSTLTACTRAAAGPAAGVTPPVIYSCPWTYTTTGVSTCDPLSRPPSSTNDIIVSCHETYSSLCYRDAAGLPFQLISGDIPQRHYLSVECTTLLPVLCMFTLCQKYCA